MSARAISDRLTPPGEARGSGAERSGRLLRIAAATGCALLFLLAAWLSMEARQRAVETTRVSARNLATGLERHASAALDAVDAELLDALATAAREPASVGQPSTILDPSLPAWASRIDVVDVARGGTVLTVTRSTAPPGPAMFVPELLDAHRAPGTGARAFVGPLGDEAGGGSWAALSRRGEEGGTARMAIARIDLRRLASIFAGLDAGPDGVLSLATEAGSWLAGVPERRPGSGLDDAVGGSRGGSSATDRDRLVERRALPGLPLAISVSLPRPAGATAWLPADLLGPTLYACAALAMIAVGIAVFRRARARDELEQESRRKSALLEATLENMDQGLMMFDADARVQVCNSRAIELLNLPPALMASRPRFDEVTRLQFRTGEFQRTDREFQDWVAYTGFERTLHSYERERPDGTVLEVRTVPIADGGAVRTYTDITERKQVEKRIAHMARHDALTGLANRLLFRERLEEALARCAETGSTLAVICLDLDDFKTINDTLGHSYGDVLLCEVSKRIAVELRAEDVVARLGGDEFAVLVAGAAQPESARRVCERLVEVLGLPFFIEGQQVHVGASIGVSIAPFDGLDPDMLLKNADLALYRAKAEGRATYRLFELSMARQVEDRRALEIDMREALVREEFVVHFQPYLDLARNRISGFEALVRWNHPERGEIPPAVFIPVAEETGLITNLGHWVLQRACEAAASWPGDITVAVNVSAMQFRNQNLYVAVAGALAASGLPAHRLELEVTETVLMCNTDGCLQALHLLRSLGVKIAMDDFGTGYSSLSYLRSYPFDKLKIDRSFVKELGKDADCLAIVRTIAGLGTGLGLVVTAEGVETEVQLDLARVAGCNYAQGYLISRPVPVAETYRLLGPEREVAAA